jgi:ribosomal protein L34E
MGVLSEHKSAAQMLREEYEAKKKPIEEEYERKRAELQATCSHTDVTDWMEEWWALGHSTGYMVQHCKNCDKEIHRRTSCHICGRTIQDDKIKKVTVETAKKAREEGQKFVLPVGGAYCTDCFSGHPPASAKKNFELATANSWGSLAKPPGKKPYK